MRAADTYVAARADVHIRRAPTAGREGARGETVEMAARTSAIACSHSATAPRAPRRSCAVDCSILALAGEMFLSPFFISILRGVSNRVGLVRPSAGDGDRLRRRAPSSSSDTAALSCSYDAAKELRRGSGTRLIIRGPSTLIRNGFQIHEDPPTYWLRRWGMFHVRVAARRALEPLIAGLSMAGGTSTTNAMEESLASPEGQVLEH